jgi:transposase InsO family protein
MVALSVSKFSVGDEVRVVAEYFKGVLPTSPYYYGVIRNLHTAGPHGEFRYKVYFHVDRKTLIIREPDLERAGADIFSSQPSHSSGPPPPPPSPGRKPTPASVTTKKVSFNTPATTAISAPSRFVSSIAPAPIDSFSVDINPGTARPDKLTKAALLHQQFNHLNFEALHQLRRIDPQFNFSTSLDFTCDVCEVSKATRKVSHKGAKQLATEVFQLLHSDSGGPIAPISTTGNTYYHLFIDHVSSYLLHYYTADQGAPSGTNLVRAMKQLRASTGHTITHLHSDCGSDYTSQEMADYCIDMGIKQTFSTPYHHDENGKVERAQRTIWDATRSILTASHAPPQLWSYAFDYVIYTRNGVHLTRWCMAVLRI